MEILKLKKKKRYELIKYAVKEYENIFSEKLKLFTGSKEELYLLLDKYKNISITEWCYCCCGPYINCWQDFYAEGVWGLSQNKINNKFIKIINRIYEKNSPRFWINDNMLVIIARDLGKELCDYLIELT